MKPAESASRSDAVQKMSVHAKLVELISVAIHEQVVRGNVTLAAGNAARVAANYFRSERETPVAWRWRWKHNPADGAWTYADSEPKHRDMIVQPLYERPEITKEKA